MAGSAGTGLPASFGHVYRIDELLALGPSGLVIAAVAAMAPAGRAAKITTASALRAE
jgi:putative ABC transport system permease protein